MATGATPSELDAGAAAFVAAAGAESRALGPEQLLGWPITRLAAWSLSLALVIAILAPTAIIEGSATSWFLLLPASLLAALLVRAAFDLLGRALEQRAPLTRGLAPAVPALLAGLLLTAAELAAGGGTPGSVGIVTGSGAALVLATACMLRRFEVRYQVGLRRVYFVGSPSSQMELERELARVHDAALVGVTSSLGQRERLEPGELASTARARHATIVVLDSSLARPGVLERVADALPGVIVYDLLSYYEEKFKKLPLESLASELPQLGDADPVARVRRTVDVALASLMLLVMTLPLLVCAVLIKLTSPGPVIYRQQRVGKDGVAFTLLKLRTMRRADAELARWASFDAARVTRVGRHLRRFRLDELPQLWNVIRGDLALIGPRPEQVPIVAELERSLPNYRLRHTIRPGITGWAQVSIGYAGSIEGARAKLQRDLYYLRRRSLRLDMLIVWLTVKMLLEGRE